MPREVHETYECDPDDPENREKHKLTGYVVITRESAWDEESRARALALTEYESGVCGCGCGLPTAVSHQKQGFVVHKVLCYAGRAIEQHRRTEQEKHKDVPGWGEGVRYFAVPAVPTDAPDGAEEDD